MSTGYSSRTWTCPFFQWDERRKVHCEGGGIAFTDGETFSAYAEKYCGSLEGWKACSIAAALLKQYEREGP